MISIDGKKFTIAFEGASKIQVKFSNGFSPWTTRKAIEAGISYRELKAAKDKNRRHRSNNKSNKPRFTL